MKVELKTILESIQKHQLSTLKHVEVKASQLESLAQDLQKKIQRNGIAGYYSVNHDVADVCFAIHRSCTYLSELKQIEMQLKKLEKKPKKKKKK
ncbi:hypothetical protein CL634_07190 [bacterium]|nr:hypothetical protein [bacterium]